MRHEKRKLDSGLRGRAFGGEVKGLQPSGREK